jgi:hypothetical protein
LLSVVVWLPNVAFAEIDWVPDIYPSNNLFPSVIVGTARVDPEEKLFAAWEGNHLGDEQGLVGATVSGLRKGDKVKLVVEANEYMKAAKLEGVVKRNSAEDLVIHPKISYRYDELMRVTQVQPIEVTMELFVNDESQGQKSQTVTVRSVNDCLFGVVEDEENTSDYTWLFSVYVNENHPWVDRLLKEALETDIISSFDGYQSGSEENVFLQIFAIWNVMQRRGMRYSDITTTAAESEGVYSQHVRLLDQSVNATQANCVDGTVLLASLLRKIGLRCGLVLVPGHMFLAVDINDDTTIGIETTLMGEQNLAKIDRKKFPSFEKLDENMQEAAWNSFEGAVSVGTDRLEQDAEMFESDDMNYQIIDVAEARRIGILPISFRER